MRIYAYLRASTKEQDAGRARAVLSEFVASKGLSVSAWFEENESGATLKRPELLRVLDIAEKGDVILLEQVDRITRLNSSDWETLKASISDKGVRLVSLDLPTSHEFLNTSGDTFTARMLAALNAMLLDVLAAVARKDYEDRRRRQAEGVQRAKREGKYTGRKVDTEKHKHIQILLKSETKWSDIEKLVPCSRATISKVKKTMES